MFENKYRPVAWKDLILPKQGKTLLQVAAVKQAIEGNALCPAGAVGAEWAQRVIAGEIEAVKPA